MRRVSNRMFKNYIKTASKEYNTLHLVIIVVCVSSSFFTNYYVMEPNFVKANSENLPEVNYYHDSGIL